MPSHPPIWEPSTPLPPDSTSRKGLKATLRCPAESLAVVTWAPSSVASWAGTAVSPDVVGALPAPPSAGAGAALVSGWAGAATAALERPRFLAQPPVAPWVDVDVFVAADRAAWEAVPLRSVRGAVEAEATSPDGRRSIDLIAQLASLRKPVHAAPQLVHGDLFGTVLFSGSLAPGLADITPYWRPPAWAAGVAVVDALSWGGADDGLLDPDDDRLTRWSTDLAALPHVQAAGHLAEISPADARITRSAPDEPEPAAALTLASASASYAAAADLRFPAGSEAVLESAAERAAWVTPDAARALHLPAPDSGVLSPGYRIWVEGQSVPVLGLVRVSERTPQLGAAVFVTRPVMAGARQPSLTLTVRTETGFPYPVSQAAPLVIDPANPGRVTTRTVADLRNLRAGVSDDLGAFVGVLSAVLLALAVISASTAMYLSVQSRTAEIALRRAIGSGRGLIARLFLLEGALIGLAGGAVGAAAGTAAVLAVAHARGWAAVLPTTAAPLSLALGLTAGVVSALYPAWVASRQRPADALRG